MSAGVRWEQMSEVGSTRSLVVARRILRSFPRSLGRISAAIVGASFAARNRAGRRASDRYLRRVSRYPDARAALGRTGLRLAVLRHFAEIGISVYDRMVVWSGSLDRLTFEHDGTDEVFGLARQGRGALLLGAHLGNLDMMGFIANENHLRLNVVAFHQNAERINGFLESLGNQQVRLIQLDQGPVQAVLDMRACIERGEFVVVMADRAAPGTATPMVAETFLGDPARFPLGPFLLAGTLGCPLLMGVCLRTGVSSYKTYMQRISPGERVPRREREKKAREWLARYVAILDETCRQYPLQWFNFFDFWEEE